ncbi:MAG TPA: DUF262 domain-containing HNH endonuclease family protein [Paludibacter sp.]
MMQFSQKSIKGLFDSSEKTMTIPVYQRAYSWEEKEIKVFFEDLKEQQAGGNVYCYGNLLLETIKKDSEYEVIDGQQRLTTLTIFVRAVLNVLYSRLEAEPEIARQVNFKKKEKMYFKDDGVIKLRPVDYDRGCFDTLIVENKSECSLSTPSQKRIKGAKDYFTKGLAVISTKEIIKIFSVLEEAQVNCIELEGKKDSALMFELQNNRGKELSNLEKLKSFFMYQLYVVSDTKETATNIEYVANKFDPIYRLINDLKESNESEDIKDLNEDRIFTYHCYAYTAKGFGYRTIDDLTDEYKKLKTDKVSWIKDFTDELHTTFSNIKLLQGMNSKYLAKLSKIGMPYFVYPFLIRGLKYFKNDNCKMDQLFKTMEILSFRYKLINSRSDIVSKLYPALRNFQGDVLILNAEIKKTLNDNWYWSDSRVEEYLNDNMYENSMVNYVLWEYEHSIQPKGYDTNKISIPKEQIEHISPKTADTEWIAAGYEVNKNNNYSEQFIEDRLNSIGNLLLISGSHNASIGNKPFSVKLKTYHNNPILKQQAEIETFLDLTKKRPRWDSNTISKRCNKILEFAKSRWSFD